MTSVREVVACLKLSGLQPDGLAWPGAISVMRDFWGYTQHPKNKSLSLLEQIDRLKGKHIHINLIRVGSEMFKDKEEQEINDAAHRMRAIYAPVNLAIGRIEHFAIAVAMANGREKIDNNGEAEALTNEWTVHNDALDVFLVLGTWQDSGKPIAGLSGVDGPCDKDDSCYMTGSVVALANSFVVSGRTLAHEVGHYLGLKDIDDAENLMCQTSLSQRLTATQGATMKEHCRVKSGC